MNSRTHPVRQGTTFLVSSTHLSVQGGGSRSGVQRTSISVSSQLCVAFTRTQRHNASSGENLSQAGWVSVIDFHRWKPILRTGAELRQL